MLVLVLVLVLERCCLEQRRVNPIRSASPELHPHNGLAVLKGRKMIFVLVALIDGFIEAAPTRLPPLQGGGLGLVTWG